MKICIVANNAYGALTGEESGHIGGVERQTALLSEWLTANGHEVIVITWNEGGSPVEVINGIKIIKLCKVNDGLPGIRFFTPRWTSLVSALKEADAEVYYHNCAEYVTGQIAMWCKLHHTPLIYSVASDADCDIDFPNLKSKREKYLFRHGLTHANLVITQTQKQKQLLQQNYSIDAQVINMPATPPKPLENFNREALFNKQKVTWVGRIHKVKRVEWLIDIAEQSPDISFDVIGPSNALSEYMPNILQRLQETKNINYLGKVSRADMPSIYQNSSILCCTSIYEGFPNTYLEAWSYGVPVITTIDPDDIIKTHNMGYHVTSKEHFQSHIELLLNDPIHWEKTSLNCQNYCLQNHEQGRVMKQFERAFLSVGFNRIGEHFDQKSESWSDYYQNSAISIAHLDLQQRLVYCQNMLANIEKQGKTMHLLDLGCGPGNSFPAIKSTGDWLIEGVDISIEMIKTAQIQHPDINLTIANASSLPFEKNRFQTVISLGVLEYIEGYPLVITEVRRILQAQGHFVVSIPNKQSVFRKLRKLENLFVKPFKKIPLLNKKKKHGDPIRHQQWSQKSFSDNLTSQGFSIENVEYCTYAFLSPKLESSTFNLHLSKWLHNNLRRNSKLKRFLANTIIIHARVNK
jgi:glycosyltransferase involved in cell wall biosynthesis/ubiquinone/menaquinone biosynthesis C-methylase UbiE